MAIHCMSTDLIHSSHVQLQGVHGSDERLYTLSYADSRMRPMQCPARHNGEA